MRSDSGLPKLNLGVYPTPLYKLKQISRKYGKEIWIKRDDLCGVALGGNKVRKLEYLLAQAKNLGADVVFTTGGAQSNHAMLTAACAARLGMTCYLLLKKRGVIDRKGNLILDEIYGAKVMLIDTDSYDEIYEKMHEIGAQLEQDGHKCYYIPCGGSNPLGAVGYAQGVKELKEQADMLGKTLEEELSFGAVVSATGSGGTTAGLLVGTRMYMPGSKLYGIAVDTDPFEEIVPEIAEGAAKLLGKDAAELEIIGEKLPEHFEMIHHWGTGYAIPNPEDTPYILELARMEGILLDPVYTGKAWSGFLKELEGGRFDPYERIVFIHTGGAAALFAMDLG